MLDIITDKTEAQDEADEWLHEIQLVEHEQADNDTLEETEAGLHHILVEEEAERDELDETTHEIIDEMEVFD